jgi:hypothetical protein
MKVYDILTESQKTKQKVDEFNPVTSTMAAFGNKAAKVELEINKEVKSIYKDYVAVSKQDPKKQGMNVDSLSRFLAAKGFANSPQEVINYIKQDTSLMKKLGKAAVSGAKSAVAGTKSAVKGAKTGAGAVIDAGKKIKKAMSKPSGLTPDPRQGELDLKNSMFSESVLLEQQMSGSEVQKVIKRFVQQGFQKQLGSRVGKSAYGDDATGNEKPSASTKTMMPDDEIQNAISVLQANGFKINTKKKTVSA